MINFVLIVTKVKEKKKNIIFEIIQKLHHSLIMTLWVEITNIRIITKHERQKLEKRMTKNDKKVFLIEGLIYETDFYPVFVLWKE